MRYPGCAAGGMRRVRRNAASKLNNGRCTSQISAMSSRRASGESCAIAASRRRRSSLSKAARSTTVRSGALSATFQRFAEYPRRLRQFFHDVRVEMRQVNWPSRQDVWSTTVVVVITVAFFGVYFAITDSLFSRASVWLLHYFKK